MSFSLSQVLVLIIMRSHSTGKQSYKRTQRASEMQCNAFWRDRLIRIITKSIEQFQTKAKQHNLEPLHSDRSLYTVAKYKTCQKDWCRRSEVCETRNPCETCGSVSTWQRPWIQPALPIPIRIYRNGNGHSNRELTAQGVMLWKNQATQNILGKAVCCKSAMPARILPRR